MNRKITIYLPSLSGGGAERVFTIIANNLVKKNYNVDLILNKAEGPYIEQLNKKVNVINFKTNNFIISLYKIISYLIINNPSVLLSALPSTNIISLIGKIFSPYDNKVIISVRSHMSSMFSNNENLKYKIFKILMKVIYPTADKIITVSKGVEKDLKNIINKNLDTLTIYNPIIYDEIFQKSKEKVNHKWFNKNYEIILGAGRLVPQKNFSTLIKSFAKIRKNRKVKLVILGIGPEKERLINLAEELGVEKDIYFPGYVNNPFKYMRESSVFVLSSAWEGLPGVLIQALACNGNVVSTDCPSGPKEILKNGKLGRLVKIGDEIGMAHSIIKSLNEPMNISREQLSPFEKDQVINKFIKVLT